MRSVQKTFITPDGKHLGKSLSYEYQTWAIVLKYTVAPIGNLKMRIQWKEQKNGMGSVDYWYIVEPLGTFIDVVPINRAQGTVYRVRGPQTSHEAEYATLARAKQVAEDLCRHSAKHPLKEVPIDLRDYPDCGIEIRDAVTGKREYEAHAIVGKKFNPPRF